MTNDETSLRKAQTITNDDDRRAAAEAQYQRWISELPRDQFDLHMMGCRAYERRGIERAAVLADEQARDAWQIGKVLGQNEVCSSGRNQGARAIAAAIRAITTEGADK